MKGARGVGGRGDSGLKLGGQKALVGAISGEGCRRGHQVMGENATIMITCLDENQSSSPCRRRSCT